MDELSEPLGGQFEAEGSLPPDAIVFRHIPADQIKNGYAPEKQFVPRPPESSPSLSLNWDKYASPESTLIQVGLQYHPTKRPEFKDPARFTVFWARRTEIESELFDEFSLIHTPSFNNNPPPFGSPNNRSHSDLDSSDEEVRIKLRNIFKEVENKPDLAIVLEKVEAIKQEWMKLLDNLKELIN
jgi:hypothetical protein